MFDVKNVSENLQSPTYRHWQQVKRIVRFLAGTRDDVQKIEVNSGVIACKNVDQHSLVGWSETDFAGNVESRWSTSLCSAQIGWSSHPHTFAQTDFDCDEHSRAELYGILSVTFEGFCDPFTFYVSWGSSVEFTTMTDSDAGRALCSRKGFGKLKQVNIRFLWIQDAEAKKEVMFKREVKHFQCCRSEHKAFHQGTF